MSYFVVFRALFGQRTVRRNWEKPREPLSLCAILSFSGAKTGYALFTTGKDKKNRVDELARRTDEKTRVHSDFRVNEQ